MSKRLQLVVDNCGAYEGGHCVMGYHGGRPHPVMCLHCPDATPIDGGKPIASMQEVEVRPKLAADEVAVCMREAYRWAPEAWKVLTDGARRQQGWNLIVPRSVYDAARAMT